MSVLTDIMKEMLDNDYILEASVVYVGSLL